MVTLLASRQASGISSDFGLFDRLSVLFYSRNNDERIYVYIMIN